MTRENMGKTTLRITLAADVQRYSWHFIEGNERFT